MTTHREFFNRAPDSYDFEAIWTVEDLCSKDLDAADDEYKAACDNYQKAKVAYDFDKSNVNLSKKNWATVEKLRVEINYYEKYAVHCDFMNN